MTTHRYDRGAIVGDYARGGFGFVITGLPLVATPMAGWVSVVFGGLAALFGIYVIRTWIRASTAIEVDAAGIRAVGPRPKEIAWDDLGALEMRYFSTRRDKEGGWMQLTLRGDGRAMSIESSLDDFDEVARRCALVARRNQLEVSEPTRDNFRALGIAEIDVSTGTSDPGDAAATGPHSAGGGAA